MANMQTLKIFFSESVQWISVKFYRDGDPLSDSSNMLISQNAWPPVGGAYRPLLRRVIQGCHGPLVFFSYPGLTFHANTCNLKYHSKLFLVCFCFRDIYTKALWVKITADDLLKYFFNHIQKLGVDISYKLSGDNLHEMSKPKKRQNLHEMSKPIYLKEQKINLSTAEYAHRVVKINIICPPYLP